MIERIKRHWNKITIGVLIILFILSSLYIYDLTETVDSLKNSYSDQINNMNQEINSIYDNVDEKLKRQSSLLTSVDIEYGELDKNNKVPVTIKVIPKVIYDNIELFTQIGKKTVLFKREGNMFLADFNVDVFAENDDLFPVLTIKTADSIKTEVLEGIEVYNLRYRYVPSIYSDYSVSATLTKKGIKLEGGYNICCESPSGNENISVKRMCVFYEVNGKEVEREDVTSGFLNNIYFGDVRKNINLKDGDSLSVWVLVEGIEDYNIKNEIARYKLENGAIEEIFGDVEEQLGETISDKSGNIIYQN